MLYMIKGKTALYRHYDSEDKLLYIGISLNPTQRLFQHQKIAKWTYESCRMTSEWFDSRVDAEDAEKKAIISEKPANNVLYSNISTKKGKPKPIINVIHNKDFDSVDGDAGYFMTFYQNIDLLHSICNKQTLFFAAMVSRMDSDQVVQMTPYVREQIIDEVRVSTKNKLGAAKQYIHKLKKFGLIADIGRGTYMINPHIHGRNNMQNSIDKKSDTFMKIVHSSDGKRKKIECG